MANKNPTYKFPKGSPGKPKGAITEVKKDARALFLKIMEGQVENIEESLDMILVKDRVRYIECLAKLMPYFLPKKLDVNVTTPKISVTINKSK